MRHQLSLDSVGLKEPDLNYITRTEKGVQTNIRGIEFPYKIQAKLISFKDIAWNPISQIKCIQCGFYGRTFFCGPKVPPYYSWQTKLSKYNFFLLIIGKINVTPRYLDDLNNFKTSHEWKAHFYAGNEGTNILKRHVRDRTTETMNYLSAFDKFRFLSTGGGCRSCRTCAVHTNEPCRHSDIANPSPEAIGIDLYTMLPESEVPPIENYYSISMVYGNLDNHTQTSINLPRRPQNNGLITNLNNVIESYPITEIWSPDESKARCKNCKFYSQFLCNRSKYKEEDLYNHIKDWHLYAIKLKNKINTVEALKELHQYQLWLHRQGYWESFQLLPFRCPICSDCSLENHMAGAYKMVNNRSIPLCVSYFNLKPKKVGENIGYILA